ncbi:prepilin peptidase [Levilactobacillus fujinensis]|uniref:Prepilin peptidase n=1 Tax=Levilactobacillus fujinensis TaxID=2486024 RepID=A0ABW1TDI2_9LACO|nr:A24 family peptidase [Levilactobacillus fujinensis]
MLIILFIYGACMGSGLVALADRYATHTSVFYPASHCDTCQTPLVYWQLVPILSYLLLRGRCHYCQAAIPATSLLIEFIAGLVLTTLTPLTVIPVLWLGLWGYAALCDARTQTFPGWVSWVAVPITLPMQSLTVVLITIALLVGIHLLWSHFPNPPIGDGDLEIILSYHLLWGVTATAQWLLTASLMALIYSGIKIRSSFPFLPFLLTSALAWWLFQ